MIPVKVKTGEEIMTAGLTLNIMTHPDYRRQGIFESLAGTSYQEAGEDGIDFVYGFPNRNSRPGFIGKLGWVAVAPLPVMIKPLNWENTLRSRVRSRLLRRLGGYSGAMVSAIAGGFRSSPAAEGLTVARVRSFDERVNRLWGRMVSRFSCCLVKDRAYLNWRYAALDDRSQIFIAEASGGEMTGYMVVREVTRNNVRMAHVFDLMAESESVLHGLVGEVARRLRESGADALIYQLLTDKAHRRMLALSGFIGLPFVQGILPAFCVGDVFQNPGKALPRSPQQWFVQLGDSDAVSGYQEDERSGA
jgi:hypothetical protein